MKKTETFHVVRCHHNHFSIDSVGRVYVGNGIQHFHKLDHRTAMKVFEAINGGCEIIANEESKRVLKRGTFSGDVEVVRIEMTIQEVIVASETRPEEEDEVNPCGPTLCAGSP